MGSKARGVRLGSLVGGMVVVVAATTMVGSAPGLASAPRRVAEGPEEAGRYLLIVGGCNDCHTPGWAESDGNLPEAEWLTGGALGFRGPWGTSYPTNLRLTVQSLTEDAFVARLQAGVGLPPMPWMNVRQMREEDQRAMYRYIRSLGPAGVPAPMPLAPGVEPTTPYIPFVPVLPGDAGR